MINEKNFTSVEVKELLKKELPKLQAKALLVVKQILANNNVLLFQSGARLMEFIAEDFEAKDEINIYDIPYLYGNDWKFQNKARALIEDEEYNKLSKLLETEGKTQENLKKIVTELMKYRNMIDKAKTYDDETKMHLENMNSVGSDV